MENCESCYRSRISRCIEKFTTRLLGIGLLGLILGISSGTPLRAQSDLLITGVIDGPLTGGLPKAVEFYAVNNIADLSIYGFGSANNGGGSDGEEFTFPADAASAGSFIYVTTNATGFTDWFGFAPDYINGSAPSINGDDAIELFRNGLVMDVFGDINVDGTGEPWEYLDGWAYRVNGSGPDGSVFVLANWSFSGPNALDGETTNGTAATPFPTGTYVPPTGGEVAPAVIATTPANGDIDVAVDADIVITFSEDVTVSGAWFEVEGTASGVLTASVSGGPRSFTLDPDVGFANGETVTVTVFAAQVSDADADDPPDNPAADFVFSFSVAGGFSGWVINEIHADPDGSIAGDANNDGTRNATQDEFVEIVNVTGAAVDISGWTLSDGFGVRHVFPSGTLVPDQCPVVVFGGGSPTGAFGGAVVQTASTGGLGLNNSGDDVTFNNGSQDLAGVSYGGEGGDNQSLTRDPDITGSLPLVKHTLASGAGGRLFSPGTLVDGSLFPGCSVPPQVQEIFEIQGSGLASPVAGQTVTSEDNVVTALASNGFFMQTPAVRSDGDPETSDGIFVFTGSAPSVSVGDQVDVTGEVIEFFDFTEFSNNPTVTVTSSGNPLPPVVSLNGSTPSPDQPQPASEYERLEGMRVQIAEGTVTGPNQRFGSDPIAEVYVVADDSRTFREPGIEFPGLPGLPVWDGNPEIFELDPDRLGLPNQIIPAGSSFEAVGVLGFEFGGYEFWPTALTVTPASLPQPVRAREAGEFTIGSLNLFRLFDSVKDGTEETVSAAEYNRRLKKFSNYIRNVLDAPDILAVQEAEKLGVLEDLAARIQADESGISYSAYLLEGNDVGGIDVGFLVRPTVQVDALTQLGADETLSVDGSPLHDRPPLLLEGHFVSPTGLSPIVVMALHNRSLSGIEDPSDGPRVRQKRLEQAQSIAEKVQALQDGDPQVRLVVIGDLNAFEFSDGYVDVVGQIRGEVDPGDNLLSGPDLVEPNLANQVLSIPAAQRYSFIFRGSGQVLDHALTSTALGAAVTGVSYGRGNADAAVNYLFDGDTPLRSSDHDGLLLYLDATPPEIVVSTDPAVLWPPNHHYATFEVADFVESISDAGSPGLTVADVFITTVSSDEPEDDRGNGDGNTLEDIVVADCQTVDLRAERAANSNGRVYTIHVAAVDQAGNRGTAAFQILVPLNQGKKGDAVDDGAVYVVESGCAEPQNLLSKSGTAGMETSYAIPSTFTLEQNYPNPFNPTTTIRFGLPERGAVTLRIYNAAGQLVRTLVAGALEAGYHSVQWDGHSDSGSRVASGLYIYRLQTGSFAQNKKMLLLK